MKYEVNCTCELPVKEKQFQRTRKESNNNNNNNNKATTTVSTGFEPMTFCGEMFY